MRKVAARPALFLNFGSPADGALGVEVIDFWLKLRGFVMGLGRTSLSVMEPVCSIRCLTLEEEEQKEESQAISSRASKAARSSNSF